MNLERTQGETDYDYQRRLVYGKLVDKTLADYDYSEIAEKIYGKPYSSDVARRMMYGSKNTFDTADRYMLDNGSDMSTSDELADIEERRIELQKERQKFFDQRSAYNKLLRDKSRQEELCEIMVDTLTSSKLPVLEYVPSEHEKTDNDLLVSLNDIHYGANINNAWCRYNSEICQKMMCNYIDKIIEIGKTHNSENCYITCAGDCISGNIHYSIAVTNKENVIEQVMGVSELIAQFVAELSKHFRRVYYISVPGNHSRINPNKNDCLKEERLDTLIDWYLAARLAEYRNVIIGLDAQIDPTMSMFKLRGKQYVLVHGDFDASVSSIQSLRSMVFNASNDNTPLYAVLCGHKHHNYIDAVSGVRVLMAGSFQGVDDFCVTKRIYGQPEQMVCVCDNNGIKCHYDIPMEYDNN